MGAQGLGRKLLLTPPPRRPPTTPEQQTLGTATASHRKLTLQALLSSLKFRHCTKRVPGPRKGCWVTSGSLSPKTPASTYTLWSIGMPFPKDPAVLKTLRDSELLRRSVFTTPPNIYYAVNPSLRGEMPVKPKERRCPHKGVAIADHCEIVDSGKRKTNTSTSLSPFLINGRYQ